MMKQTVKIAESPAGLSDAELFAALDQAIAPALPSLRKVLLIPPDFTRFHSGAGKITAHLYERLSPTCRVDILPALGTHVAMPDWELRAMFGETIPLERFIVHNWRTDVVKLGEVPQDFVTEVSEGLVKEAIPVEVNRLLVDPSYDLILSIGQVVPHEVVGMANYGKNLFVGCGGRAMINASHMLGAFYGLERIMGRDFSPVRKVFDYAEAHFLPQIPLCYILTVTTAPEGDIQMHGLFIGRERALFEQAVALSQQKNLTFVDAPLKKVVVYLDPQEFKSTWLGNKAVYRTRMAMADGGELLVLAPGVERFGEDADIDRLIRKYGYCGREQVLALVQTNDDLKNNLSAAAHLIHGSSDGRFAITYCTQKVGEGEVRGVNFGYLPYEAVAARYDPHALKDGFNTLADGEEVYFISNPALGLWADKGKF
ncbi:MAG: nickel-dependent lactate racemase [Oscillospiraceae bacterium]|jgi:nickel-dependent lactate racemase|nr:nickel-dependent lactate racemase [Oscillospiraceae bacterium]